MEEKDDGTVWVGDAGVGKEEWSVVSMEQGAGSMKVSGRGKEQEGISGMGQGRTHSVQ